MSGCRHGPLPSVAAIASTIMNAAVAVGGQIIFVAQAFCCELWRDITKADEVDSDTERFFRVVDRAVLGRGSS